MHLSQQLRLLAFFVQLCIAVEALLLSDWHSLLRRRAGSMSTFRDNTFVSWGGLFWPVGFFLKFCLGHLLVSKRKQSNQNGSRRKPRETTKTHGKDKKTRAKNSVARHRPRRRTRMGPAEMMDIIQTELQCDVSVAAS